MCGVLATVSAIDKYVLALEPVDEATCALLIHGNPPLLSNATFS